MHSLFSSKKGSEKSTQFAEGHANRAVREFHWRWIIALTRNSSWPTHGDALEIDERARPLRNDIGVSTVPLAWIPNLQFDTIILSAAQGIDGPFRVFVFLRLLSPLLLDLVQAFLGVLN